MNEFEELLMFYGTDYMILTYAKSEQASRDFKEMVAEQYDYLLDRNRLLEMSISDFLEVFATFCSKELKKNMATLCSCNDINTVQELLNTSARCLLKQKSYLFTMKVRKMFLEHLKDACHNAGFEFK